MLGQQNRGGGSVGASASAGEEGEVWGPVLVHGRRGSVGANASVWEEGRVLAAAVEQRCAEVRGLLWERSHDNK